MAGKTPEQIQAAMRKAIAAKDSEAVAFFRGELGNSYRAESAGGAAQATGEENLLAGIGSGMINVGRRAGNLVGLVDQSSIDEQTKLDAPLAATGAGKVGQFIGETAPLLALTGGAGGLAAKGATAARGAAGAVPRLARALGSLPGRAALEGAVGGGIMADEGERVGGALLGGGLGYGLSKGAQALKRATGGLVKPSKEALRAEKFARETGGELDLPIADYASNRDVLSKSIGSTYQGVLPYVPGASSKLERTRELAEDALRARLGRGIAPASLTLGPKAFAKGNIQKTIGAIDDAFTKEFDNTIGSYSFNAPQSADDVAAFIKRSMGGRADDAVTKQVADDLIAQINAKAKNGVLDGRSLTRIQRDMRNLGREAAGKEEVGQAYYQATNYLDDLVDRELVQHAQGSTGEAAARAAMDVDTWKQLRNQWKPFKTMEYATGHAADRKGAFTAKELMSAVKGLNPIGKLARGEAPLQREAGIGMGVLSEALEKPSVLGRSLALSSVGIGGAMTGTLPLVGGAIGAGNLLASRTGQRLLKGSTKGQKAIINALRRNKGAMQKLGQLSRAGLSSTLDDEDY